MNLPDFLGDDGLGEILLTGHRISLYHLVSRYQNGYSVEQLKEAFPTLSMAIILDVIAFYLANKAEIDLYVAETSAELDRQYEAGQKLDLEGLEKCMRAMGWPGGRH